MTQLSRIVSKDGVCDVEWIVDGISSPTPPEGRTPDLLVEVPHGATAAADYERLRSRLSPDLPADLIDFFFVNTDVGAYEYGREVALRVASPRNGWNWFGVDDAEFDSILATAPPRCALVIRCRLPRTLVDANRIEGAGDADESKGALNAAISEYVREESDRELLTTLHREYHSVADPAFDLVCGSGGLAFTPHSYAPKAIIVESFDEGIGQTLRDAYSPERYDTWETRPAVDLITLDPEGVDLSPRATVDRIVRRFSSLGIDATENASYRMHPVTMAYRYAKTYPGQVLCLEARRDLLADPFVAFQEMTVGAEKAARIAAPIAASIIEELQQK